VETVGDSDSDARLVVQDWSLVLAPTDVASGSQNQPNVSNMRRGKHSKRIEIQDAPEVSDLGRGSMIRFGNQRFRIDDTALLGNVEVSFQRGSVGDDWEITLSVGGLPLMGEWGLSPDWGNLAVEEWWKQ